MKKNYEELQRQFEQLGSKYGNCRNMVDELDALFENDDLERLNEIQMLDDRLQEEEENIYGKQDKQQRENEAEDYQQPGEDEFISPIKRKGQDIDVHENEESL